MKSKKETLLWDADGTIIYSQPWWEDTFCSTAKYFGLSIPESKDLRKTFAGMTLRQMYERVVSGGLDIEECLAFHIERQYATTHLITLFEGEYEVLNTFDGLGIKQAIVTSRTSRSLLVKNLKDLGIDNFFRFIVCTEDVANPKPDPEGIYLAMKRLGSDKDSTFMIGDTHFDIEAGKNAGIGTIGVLFGDEQNDEESLPIGADFYVASFSEIADIVLSR